ncbi:MAG: hypothetical protein HKN23_08365, partial [Verrucomicrobiales bacterium]|nr:hypothetical protein [Verrucomicrobiales bacterium]
MAHGTTTGGTGVGKLKQSELEKSRQYYLKILGKVGPDEDLERARALHSLAHLELRLEHNSWAKDRFETAIEALEVTIQNRAGETAVVNDAEFRLADCYENLSHLLGSGTGTETLAALKTASDLFTRLLEREPGDYDLSVRQAGNDFRLATVFHLHRRYEEAIDAFSRAAATAEKLLQEQPDTQALQEMIAQLQFRVAKSLRAAGRFPEAVDAHLAALESLVTLKGDGRYTEQQTLQIAEIYVELGELFADYAPDEEQDQLFNESLRMLSPLNEKNPEDVAVAICLCRSLIHLGHLESKAERWSEGYRLSVRGIERLIEALGGEETEANHIDGLLALAEARARHISLLKYQESAALKIAAKGVATLERVETVVAQDKAMEDPIRRAHQFRMAGAYENYGNLCKGLGDTENARICFERASKTRDLLALAERTESQSLPAPATESESL